jgi:hypothetical protein
MGYHRLPNDLDFSSVCTQTGLPILHTSDTWSLATTTEREQQAHAGLKSHMPRTNLPGFGMTIPHEGISFFARSSPMGVEYLMDDEDVVSRAFSSGKATAAVPVTKDPWQPEEEDESGRKIIRYGWEDLGMPLAFDVSMPSRAPLDWIRNLSAWQMTNLIEDRKAGLEFYVYLAGKQAPVLYGDCDPNDVDTTIDSIKASLDRYSLIEVN